MNREIKFRAWTGSKMEYNVMAGFLGAFYVQGMNERDSSCLSEFNTKYGDETPIMQYTGLKDKNGKEIYEGDALDDNKPWVVKRSTNGAWLLDYANGSGEKYLYPINKYLEIIGNIYENPELLTPKTP